LFVKACIRLGVDGFYASTQGGESARFADKTLFETCVKPYDLVLMEEMNRACPFNILHICDYHSGYDDLTPFLDYPGHVINCSLELGDAHITGKDAVRMFQRPWMGGIERKGIIASGTQGEVAQAVAAIVRNAPDKYILGADCTVPGNTSWDNLRTAIATAHACERE
jgi:uroporphyrinogen decarboxylase